MGSRMIRQPDDPGVDELARAMRQQETGALFWFCVSILAIGIVLLAWFVPVSVARAHDWYPYNCCSGYDCRRIDDKAVELRAGGFFIPESGELISYGDERVKRTPPEGGNFYHRCSRGGEPDGETICLYVPNFGA